MSQNIECCTSSAWQHSLYLQEGCDSPRYKYLYKYKHILKLSIFTYFFAIPEQNVVILPENIKFLTLAKHYRAFSGVFGHLKKNPVNFFIIEKRKGPRQKISGITHPLSYKA